jgi:hypothetical protein
VIFRCTILGYGFTINIRYLETRSDKVYFESKKYNVGVITRL